MDVNRINFRHLRAFCEVAVLGSISGAAHRVHLSQPAVTQAIAKLEGQVGVALFERTTEGLLLTEPGELFHLRAESAIQHIEEGTRPTARRGQKQIGGSAGGFERRITAAQLRALLAVAKTGSFSRAARLIGMSQSALYRMARSLEKDAGIALFDVVSRGVVLTRAADRLARHAALAFEELEQALEDIAAWSGRDTARVRIGTLPLARTYLLPHAINAFLDERPDAYLSVVDGPYDTLVDALRYGEIDMLIGALRAPEAVADIEQQALFEDRLALVARPDHPLAARTEITLEDLSNFSWIVPRPGAPTRSNFEGMFEDRPELRPTHVVEASSLILIRGILTESDAVALISAHQIRHEESLNILARLNFRVPSAPRQIGLSLRRNWRPTLSQQRMIDLLFKAGAEVAAHYPDPH
ncbi:LysR family transcriptional regulator [Nisaea nitritireducens]|uniref:LysR family transcriptional regulator n=1 Tax=Nisaea nitritireducens TaxID=568392 RepID=UPI001866695A|nr:LysR family transcriptional regulator [Nisaea nitritireducens]